ncbi:MAG: histidine kinase [Cytophagales bacterium]|nr:histidine kinase [Cytophagales bacterium]
MAIDAERLKKESMEAQYNNLKNQVNPHFLFNSLNALTNLVYQDQAKAVKFIKQLSEVYRYVLDSRDKEVVQLEEEMHFLESYVFLQQIRFGD